jgi:hypothetical protein
VNKLVDRSAFLGEPVRIDDESLRWAWDLYFAKDTDPSIAATLDDFGVNT